MINLLLAAILLPLIGIIILWRRPRRPVAGWVASFLLALGMVAFSFFAAPWGYLGMPGRYAVGGLFLAALVISLRRPIDDRADDSPTRLLVKGMIGFFFGSVALSVLSAKSVPPNPLELGFPLAGKHIVIHGGSTPAANTYVGRGSQSFGVDVTTNVGETVLAPCDGAVIAPVKLQCGNVTVELRGVASTAKIAQRGAPLGRTTERQLHIHAERNGQPVPILFDGRWLVRNDVIGQE